jgi:flagella basal body P-ring formation protein FlgA
MLRISIFFGLLLLPTQTVFAWSNTNNSKLAVVRVSEETVVRRDRFALGDVAEISSVDNSITERLRAVSLGYAPNVGAVREITRERISLAIASAGFGANDVLLESPTIVRIKRAAQTIGPDSIRAAVENALLAELKTQGATAELVRLDIPQNIETQMGQVEVRVGSARAARDYFSPFIVSIEMLVDGRVVRRLSATAQISVSMPVLVATRDIRQNERIRETDVQIEVARLDHPVSFYLRDVSDLRGRAANRVIARGETITTNSVVSGIVVKPGDSVRIIGKSGALQIAVAGEARAAGRIGDRIQVKNLQSGILLQAIVVDEGLVEVNF